MKYKKVSIVSPANVNWIENLVMINSEKILHKYDTIYVII